MKHAIYLSAVIVMLAGMVCMAPSSIAATYDCEEIYFSPDDINHDRPLLKPHPEFMQSHQLAKAGNAVEQRNIAVSYDAGYLVKACPEKALYWYQEAARNGDQIAQEWLARDSKFKALHDKPEYMTINKTDLPETAAKEDEPNMATSPSGISSNPGKATGYKCINVLDGSEYYSSKPCLETLGKGLVNNKGAGGIAPY